MKILVLGAKGFLGKWVLVKLRTHRPDVQIVETSLSLGVDLRESRQTNNLFESTMPDYVINCATYVGGIQFGYIHPAEIFNNNKFKNF